eukprot:g11146.t1
MASCGDERRDAAAGAPDEFTAGAASSANQTEKSSRRPSADTVACRGKLRGLVKELIRMSFARKVKLFIELPRYSMPFRTFVEVVDPDLHNTLRSYNDVALVEAHGE